ncbi:major facilitator superfamily transporter [Secundilactobacillus pentosiphilus]|uniref:Major facilitator superfamily transporter n=1 Tax=Secundilactobacillus pentosiphilus TaxID=1714682 RepID=A0A1Z5IP31_9LACO|nr:DHA2 family efflux MFS transporter permease subunit [Secundilactobacillus pentosiphilus]GAX03342.1 major facilitator superfamily transporter [Secundilactobacillus pentosiphilus]
MSQSTTTLSGRARLWFVMTLLMGTFTMSISQSAVSTAYPTLMRYFSISASTVQWLTTGFMLIMCIMMPVSPWLLSNIGFKSLFLSVLIMFDVGTLLIILAPNFPLVLLGRALEAIGVGILFPSYQTVLLTITPREERGGAMGLAGLVMGSALAVGPIISGIVLRFTTWQGLFIVFMIIITLVILLSLKTIINVMPQVSSHLDWLSVVSLVGFIGVLYVINLVGTPGVNWGSASVILIVSILLLLFFGIRQLRLKEPLLDLRVFKVVQFNKSVWLTGLSYIALIVVTIVFPLYYQIILGVSPFISGMALVPGAVFLSILNPVTGRLADKIGFKKVLLIGMAMILVGWGILALIPGKFSLWAMMPIAMLIEGGNAFVMMPATTLGADALPNEKVSHGTAVITTMRQLLGSTGVAVATILLSLGGVATATLGNFHIAFIVFFILEIIGLLLALSLKDKKIKD